MFVSEIQMISNYCRVSKHVIMEKAQKCLLFEELLDQLNLRYPYSIVEEEIFSKVRALSVSQRLTHHLA